MKAYDGAKPSVGRIVHYYYEVPQEPFAAMIVSIHISEGISLAVMGKAPVRLNIGHNPVTVIDRVPFSEEPKAGHWTWPPRV